MKKKAGKKAGKGKKKQRKAMAIAFKALGALSALFAAGYAVVASRAALLGAARTASTPLMEKWREFRHVPAIDDGPNSTSRTSTVDPAITVGSRFARAHS